MQNLTIGVIFGGRSTEHEVSIITGHQVMDALETAGYSILPIYITKNGEWYGGQPLYDIKKYTDPLFDVNAIKGVYRVSLSPDRSIRELLVHPVTKGSIFKKIPQFWADVFFPAIHGTFGEDGTLQGLFELADVPYVGSNVLASAVGMDKVRMKSIFKEADIPVLDCLSVSRKVWGKDYQSFIDHAERFCNYPMILKPVNLGSSIGVKVCQTSNELKEAIETALELDEEVLVERALQDFIEINCAVIGPPPEASVCEQVILGESFLTFEDKYKQGSKFSKESNSGMAAQQRIIPAPISSELTSRIQDLSIKAFQSICSSGIARFDFLIEGTDNKLYLNEVNTIPGSFAFYLWEAKGISFDKLVTMLINIALERSRIRNATKFTFESNLLQKKI